MASLTLTDFNVACGKLNPKCYTFNSTRQEGHNKECYGMLNRFSGYDYMLQPNSLFFHGISGDMQFNNVLYVECAGNFPDTGGEFNVVCYDEDSDDGLSKYRMWAVPSHVVS